MKIGKKIVTVTELREAMEQAYIGLEYPHNTVVDKIALKSLGLTRVVATLPPDGWFASKVHHQLAWCRTWLTKNGYLTPSDGRGHRNLSI